MRKMKLVRIALISAISIVALLLVFGASNPSDLKMRAAEALEYCKENGYSEDYCLLVDYGRHSGKVRFFMWDFSKNRPVLKSLCAHGYGKGSTAKQAVFSNEVGSFCSSLGYYRVGTEKTMSKREGRKALLLYGLDETNSNALQRGILIHPVNLPAFTIFPFRIPVRVYRLGRYKIRPKSEGCITIPFKTYTKVSETVKSSGAPLLLWVYD